LPRTGALNTEIGGQSFARDQFIRYLRQSPIDANGISLTAQVLPGVAAGKPAGANALQVTVQINPRTHHTHQ
jgi:hypothetical protein